MKVKIFIVILFISLIGMSGYSIAQYSKINTLVSKNKKLEEQIKKTLKPLLPNKINQMSHLKNCIILQR